MTTNRLATLVLLVALGLGVIFVLPKSKVQPLGLRLVNDAPMLATEIGGWDGKDIAITRKEIETLGLGTQFARKIYTHPGGDFRGYTLPVTIVLSGRDISNSIHRPERCLDAQGWQILDGKTVDIKIPNVGSFPVRRLHNSHTAQDNQGKPFSIEAYTYYWFIGEHELTASHWGRYFVDMRDRVFRGVDQRWAYVSLTAIIPPHHDAAMQAEIRRRVELEVHAFIADLAVSIHGEGVHYE